ncbi:MAG: TPM domain-containing protein [Syntrophobacteraceae bacterium]
MRKIPAICLFFLLSASIGYALDVPALQSHVNDYAGMLSPREAQALEARLTDFEKTDSTQIVILTIPSLDGENLEDFSIRVADAWRIGQKGQDNGAVLLIAKKERKIRIEVGRGLEGKLTDLVSGRIIRNEIAPRFKAGQLDAGISRGVSAIIGVVRGEYKASHQGNARRGAPRSTTSFLQMLIFLFIGCLFLGSLSKVAAGIGGAVGLPLVTVLSFPGLALAALIGLGILGFGVGTLVALFNSARGRGGAGGGFIGGGFGGGSFGGGGGFSGGGGTFGGGGASGDW